VTWLTQAVAPAGCPVSSAVRITAFLNGPEIPQTDEPIFCGMCIGLAGWASFAALHPAVQRTAPPSKAGWAPSMQNERHN